MDRKHQETALAVCLIGLAGYMDALGYLVLKDLFVSFMSGNSTQFAVTAAQGTLGQAMRPAAIIATFVLGAMAGSVIGRLAGARRALAVMVCVALTLAAAGVTHHLGQDFAAAVIMTLAMGMQNSTTEGQDWIPAGTYVTGTLVKLGQGLAALAFGAPAKGWSRLALLWLGLVTGGALGAFVWSGLHLDGLWIGVGGALALAVAVNALEPRPT